MCLYETILLSQVKHQRLLKTFFLKYIWSLVVGEIIEKGGRYLIEHQQRRKIYEVWLLVKL